MVSNVIPENMNVANMIAENMMVSNIDMRSEHLYPFHKTGCPSSQSSPHIN